MTGVIKNIMMAKGFGFIKTDKGTEYFFHREDYLGHWQDLVDDVMKGTVEVEFEGGQAPKGPRARNVLRVSEVPK